MSKLAENLALAWHDIADREAYIAPLGGVALFTPEERERSSVAFRRAVDWYRYWRSQAAA